MNASLFQRGIGSRLAIALGYGLLAFGAVYALDAGRSPARTSPAPAGSPEAAAHGTLCIESIEPVAAWTVRVDGVLIASTHSDAHVWISHVTYPAGAALALEALPDDSARSAANSFRIRMAGTIPSRDQAFWCAREWTVVLPLAGLAPAAAPIDPADLP